MVNENLPANCANGREWRLTIPEYSWINSAFVAVTGSLPSTVPLLYSKHMPAVMSLEEHGLVDPRPLLALLIVAAAIVARGGAEELSATKAVVPALEPFDVKDCTGPAAGKTLCYYCRYERRPVICLFVREMNDDIARLVADVDALVGRAREQRAAGFVVLLGDDTLAAQRGLRELARQRKIENLPLTIYRDTPEKLADSLGVSRDAALTVRWWSEAKIVGEQIFASPPGGKTSADILTKLKQFTTGGHSAAASAP